MPATGAWNNGRVISHALELSQRFADLTGIDPELRPATRPEFGHFQTNVALRLAKTRGQKPRDIAAELVEQIDLSDLCEPLEIAGPGFINIRLSEQTLVGGVTHLLQDPDTGIARVSQPQRIVIDYSGPNVAKQMHVGHLRSTIIGDSFHRVLTALGHTVIAQNHIGDWGTQFGQLLEQLDDEELDAATLSLAEADALYKRAAARFKSDESFAARARKRVVSLQGGDPASLKQWEALLAISKVGFNLAYARLNVLLTDHDLAGESTYNDQLAEVAADVESSGVAVIDNGALCIFVEGYDAPLIVRKSDGGYGYDITDLTAIQHRVTRLEADRIIYVTDVRQHAHFMQVFGAARKAGYLPDSVVAEHVGYGMVLGEDNKPLKSRDGSAATLVSLLDAAEAERAPEIAMGAIKYADLSNGLNRDYVFDLDRMIQTQGDTGPYLQYAHARICQVQRKAVAEELTIPDAVSALAHPSEQALALLLSRYGETVAEIAQTLQPHKLCTYLHEVAVAVARFYDDCPVLRSEGEIRSSRLGLVEAARRVLAHGLGLLGIAAPQRM